MDKEDKQKRELKPVTFIKDANGTEIAKGIDTNSNVVKFSQDSLLKNRGLLERSTGHPELAISDYELLPEILSDAQVVVRHGENKFQFFYEKKGVVYSAATKVTGNGEIFLQTLFKSRKSYMNSQMKKGTIVKNVFFLLCNYDVVIPLLRHILIK